MGYVIALAGKGGTGKTTIVALLTGYLAGIKACSVLAIDADPNSNLNQALGMELNETVVGILDKIAAARGELPAGMTKDRYIEYEVQNSVTEGAGFDLLAMGRPEGPGCYCYANTVLRGVIKQLSAAYDFVVIDNEAGMEHLSRRTARRLDAFFIVSDFSAAGIRSAKRISELAKEMGLQIGAEYLVVNMARGSVEALRDEIEKSGLNLIGSIPFDEAIARAALEGKPVTGITKAAAAFLERFGEIIKCHSCPRESGESRNP